jgi:hypothetical protein
MQAGNWRATPRHALEHYMSYVNLPVLALWKFFGWCILYRSPRETETLGWEVFPKYPALL